MCVSLVHINCRIVSLHGGAWQREGKRARDEGGSHGPTCPPHRRPSAFPIILFPHTADSCGIEPYAAAPEPCIRDARSTISISLMMNLQAWIDDLRHRTIGMIDFKQSGVNIPVVSAESN